MILPQSDKKKKIHRSKSNGKGKPPKPKPVPQIKKPSPKPRASSLRRPIRVYVAARSDTESHPVKQQRWADYWIKAMLEEALKRRGFQITKKDVDVGIQIFGGIYDIPECQKIFSWIIGKPEQADPNWLKQFDKVFSSSKVFAQELTQQGIKTQVIYGGSSFVLPKTKPPFIHDVIFVGHWRPGGRKAVEWLKNKEALKLEVWGMGWGGRLPKYVHRKSYLPYNELSRLYASSKISLNDEGYKNKAEKGFINFRVFDILASGGFCITEKNPGIQEIFGNAVPQYDSPERLTGLVKHFLTHPEDRNQKALLGYKLVQKYTWDYVAEQFEKAIKK